MVKVIIERHVKPGSEAKLEEFLTDIRSQAMYHSPGFVSGEVLTAMDDPLVKIIIGTFLTIDNWKQWESNPVRQEILRRMEPLLTSPPREAVYVARP
jgi:antibiotic biosynthesis monooxygenase (ABM) superfamily enzyme